ncbi:hypothetical protein QVD17_01976 [Tagetes erecta]|uniref:Uncharacterized protein n=1 Tax=Tagetes erecta TaxID=13708 RepID=A0AAD8L8B6_TARER|nr:hypothetical protein QVD17_01976 [Tagetes erecta]
MDEDYKVALRIDEAIACYKRSMENKSVAVLKRSPTSPFNVLWPTIGQTTWALNPVMYPPSHDNKFADLKIRYETLKTGNL